MASEIDLETLLASLPACKRCRKNRRRCDTRLPSCANCCKAGVECNFYDHALQEELPRSYIASLVENWTRDETETTAATVEAPIVAVVRLVPTTDDSQVTHHFAYAQGAYRYIGAGSHLLNVRTEDAKRTRSVLQPTLPTLSGVVVESIPGDLRIYLTQLFFETVHQVYPLLDPLNSAFLFEAESIAPGSPVPSATQEFVKDMVCAVACHYETSNDFTTAISLGERKQRLHALGAAAHARALRYIEQATAAQAVSTLQVVVLLVLYTLVCPATGGNISQQLGFAIRLVIDLCESGSESEDGEVGEDSVREKQPSLASLYKVIYCLENHVCGVLVRPTALPEPAGPLVIPLFSELMANPTTHSDSNRSLDLLCTLYRVQARSRNTNHVDGTGSYGTLRSAVLTFADDYHVHEALRFAHNGRQDSHILHPNVVAVLGETCLLLDPTSINAAIRVLEAHSSPHYLATFLSPYWVHRAATIVIQALATERGPVQRQLVRAYGKAVSILTLWAGTWDAAGVLRQDLEQRLEEGKSA